MILKTNTNWTREKPQSKGQIRKLDTLHNRSMQVNDKNLRQFVETELYIIINKRICRDLIIINTK